MAQFGKRNAGGHAAPPSRQTSQPPNIDAAVAAINAGKLPAWATTTLGDYALMLTVVAAALWFITTRYAEDMVRDIRLAGTWQVAYDLQASSGSCTTIPLLTFCSAEIRSIAEPAQPPISTRFLMFMSFNKGKRLVAVRSTSDPSAVGIAYAVQTSLTSREVTFSVLMLLLAAALLAIFCRLARGRYKDGPACRALLAALIELKLQAERAQALSRPPEVSGPWAKVTSS
jgi:hypothetical protein